MTAESSNLAPRPAHPAMTCTLRAAQPALAKAMLEHRINWGGLRPRLSALGGPHFLLMGETGSGKSVLMKLMMRTVLGDDGYDLRYRSLVFDPKGEFIPFLRRCGVPDRATILTNPFDARSAAWDIAADITNEADSVAVAEAIAPRKADRDNPVSGENVFWNNAANQIIRYVIDGFNQTCPGAWDLRDVVLACMDRDYLRAVLPLTYAGERASKNFLEGDQRLADSVHATLDALLAPVELIANMWTAASTRFSIKQWARGGGVLVLSADPAHEETCTTANNLLIRAAIQAILSKPEDTTGDYTWFFLDELREAGRFPRFSSLMNLSRSKGGRVVLASQNKSGLNAAFGKDEANEVVGACNNQVLLALGSEEDAKWASAMFSETYADTTSTTVGQGSVSTTQRDELRPLIPPITFRQLPLASNTGGAIEGFGAASGGMWYAVKLSADDVNALMPPRDSDPRPSITPRDPRQLRTQPWTDADFARLRLRTGDRGAPGGRRPLRVPASLKQREAGQSEEGMGDD